MNLEVIFAFLIGLTMLTLMGHGLWLGISFVFRSLFNNDPPDLPTVDVNRKEDDRLVAQRYIRRLYYEGKIPDPEFQKLLKYTTEEYTTEETKETPTKTAPERPDPVRRSQLLSNLSSNKPKAKKKKSHPEITDNLENSNILKDSDFLDDSGFLDESDFLEESTIQKRPVAFTPDRSKAATTSDFAEVPEEKHPIGSLLNAFMEDKNIRWGELISGLLIVGSAIGLVISLWSTLKSQIPYFPGLLFLLATAAIHGAGLYTYKRWNLESTSRGLLLITVLLVPLNFLAAIRLSDHRPMSDPLFMLAIGIGFAAFGWMIYSASRILLSFGRWQLLSIIMTSSAGQIIISRTGIADPSFLQTNLLALFPIGCFILAIASVLWQTLHWKNISDTQSRELITLGGLSLFAVLAPCWLLVWSANSRLEAFAYLTPLISMIEILLMGIGLVLHHRKGSDDSPHWSLTGSSIAICSALMILVNFVVAWPRVEIMIVLGIVNCICLALMANVGRFVLCHIPALLSGAVAGLLVFHVFTNTIALQGTPQKILVESLLLGRSAIVLIAFAIFASITALFLKRANKNEAASYYVYTAVCFSIISSLIAIYSGFITQTDSNWSTLSLLINTIICLFANCKIRKQVISAVASLLCFLMLQHALGINATTRSWLDKLELLPNDSFVWGCLIHASLGILFLVALHYWSQSRKGFGQSWSIIPFKSNPFSVPIVNGSLLTSSLILPYSLFGPIAPELHASYLFWIMFIWIGCALIKKSDVWFMLTQLAGTAGSLYTATAIGERYSLWDNSAWSDPRYWLFHIMAVAIWNVLGSIIQSKKYSRNMLGALSRTSRLNIQPALLLISILSTGFVLFLSIMPAIAADFDLAYKMKQLHHFSTQPLIIFYVYFIFLVLYTTFRAKKYDHWSHSVSLLAVFIAGAALSLRLFNISLSSISFLPSTSQNAFGYWSWGCLVLLAIACIPYINSRYQKITSQAMHFIVYLIPYLCAGHFIEQHQTADVLRWGLGIYALLLMILVLKSDSLIQYLRSKQVRLRYLPQLLEDKPTWRNLSIVGASLPLIVLTIYQLFGFSLNIDETLAQSAISIQIMPMMSFSVPVLMLMTAAVFYAIHFRSAVWMLIGSHLLAMAVMAGTIIGISEPLNLFDMDDYIRSAIYTGLAFSFYGLFWLAIEKKINPHSLEQQNLSPASWPFIRVHFTSMLCLIVIPFLLPFLMNLGNPEHDWKPLFPEIPRITLLSFIMAFICVQRFSKRYSSSFRTNGFTFLILALIGFCTVLFWQHSEMDAWRINLMMETGLIFVAAIHTIQFVLIKRKLDIDAKQQTNANRHFFWCQLLASILFVFALRGGWSDPIRPQSSIFIMTSLTAMFVTFGIYLRKEVLLAYASLATALLGTIFLVTAHWFDLDFHIKAQHAMDLLKWMSTTAAVMAGCWLTIDLYRQKRIASHSVINKTPALQQNVARTLACLVLSYTLLVTALRSLLISSGAPVINDLAGWIALGTTTLLLVGLLWDSKSRYCLPALFVMGLGGIATYLSNETNLRLLVQHSGLALSCYVCLLGGLWSMRSVLTQNATRLAVPNIEFLKKQTFRWLPQMVSLLSIYVMLALLDSVLRFEDEGMRWLSVLGVALTSPALYLISSHQELSQLFKKRALYAAGVCCIYFGWVLIPVEDNFNWLTHLIRLLETLSILCLVFTLALTKLPSLSQDWSEAFRKNSRTYLMAAGITLMSILIWETKSLIDHIPLKISESQIAIVSVALVALSSALIVMAAIPQYDPFQFSLKKRMRYVYAAEIVLALLFLHIYLTMPELFRGYLLPYWPYIVIAIAFTGVGVGEFFQRIGLNVLSEPLQKTGAFLPLLPALGFWVHAASRQETPVVGYYSMILLLIGIVYITLSLWRKSFIYTTLAALAGNGALWAFWMEQGQVFSQHPQLWLIPPALSVLIATHLNRDKLSSAQTTAIRYFATITIYVSSTGDMFIAGVADSLWLPVILCSLSLFGIFAGMLLQVRAFLYVGASFLALSIVSMIWHASQSLGHVWPWWAFGIGLGICILVLFGTFEKRRNEMLELVDKLKAWER